MGASTDWRDIKYAETLEDELRGLRRRRESGSGCTVAELEGTLAHLYIMEGADWGGRGEVQDITLGATIAAYEQIIAEWKAEAANSEKA
ncbi:MAG: hypothetical protein LBP80_11120 [Treponema sp.]|nr:hypothetical protein [Treponema sp.]